METEITKKIIEKLDYFKKYELKTLINCILIVFVIGFIAHSYAYNNISSLSHDALNEFYLYGPLYYYDYSIFELKICTGRFLDPLYFLIFRGPTTTPWLSGIVSLLWGSISLWLITKIFNINSRIQTFLIGAVLITNLSYIGEAGAFIHEIDAYMFSSMCAIASVYFWNKGYKYYFLSVLFLFVSMGIYQAMLSVSIALIIFISIKKLINNTDYKKVLLEGVFSIIIIAISGALYLFFTKQICNFYGLEIHNGHNSLTHLWDKYFYSKKQLVIETYLLFFETLLKQPSIQSETINLIIQVALLLLFVVLMAIILIKQKIEIQSKVLIIILLIVLPFGMNLSYYGNNGSTHTLMYYAIWFSYILLLIITDCFNSHILIENSKKILISITVYSLMFVLVWGNIKTANAVYVKKALEYEQTYSIMTRIADKLESFEGYKPGETPVTVIGRLDFEKMEWFSDLYDIVGQQYLSTVSSENFIDCYFRYVLNRPIKSVSWDDREKIATLQEVKNMEVFPSKNSIKWIGDIVVIKVNDTYIFR